MKLARISGAALVLSGLAFVAVGLLRPAGEAAGAAAGVAPSAAACASCHAEVHAEWSRSWHAAAFVDPEVRKLSNDYANEQCIDCHAPRPVLETGVGEPPLPRAARRSEGVDCLACHGFEGGVAARSRTASGACAPRYEPRLSDPNLCGSCHDQHHTVAEWRATPFPGQGIGCVACHMGPVDRKGGKGADHASPASHDLASLRKAVAMTVRREGAELAIAVKNVGAGHHFPTDERSRAADLIVRVLAPGGAVESIHKLDRYRNPYRDEVGASRGLPYREESPLVKTRPESTLLPFGVERTYRFAVPPGPGVVEVLLTYKTIPYPTDAAEILADERAFADGKAFVVLRESVER